MLDASVREPALSLEVGRGRRARVGVEMLPDSYEITMQDLQDALKRQNLALQTGDAVIVHTGWADCGARTTSDA